MTLRLLPGSNGGLPPAAAAVSTSGPPETEGPQPGRRRMLTSADRAVIAACLQRRLAGEEITLEQIGALIDRDKSVISREIARNSGPDGTYYATLANRTAEHSRRRAKEFRLLQNPALCRRIEEWMDQGWSPMLIATILKRDHPHTIMERVSHETIYKALYVQTRGMLRKDLYQQLSTHRPRRQTRAGRRRASSPYREAFTIAERPADIERAFGIFQRLVSRMEYEGTGIGLALCKKIVEQHKGYISARSKPNEGSTFIVSLPLQAREQTVAMSS